MVTTNHLRTGIASLRPSQQSYKKPPVSNDAPPALALRSSLLMKYLVVSAGILFLLNALVVLTFFTDFDFPEKMKFYFDREGNLPTYFSSCILLVASGILGVIGLLKKQEQNRFATHWLLLALIFLGLSVDEAVSFHEVLIEPLYKAYHLSGVLRFPWVLAGGLFVGLFVIAYSRFFLALAPPMKKWFFLSGFLYVGGAIGMEMLGGACFVGYEDFSTDSVPYIVVMTLEETLEMSGILVFIHTLLRYLNSYSPQVRIAFR